MTKANTSRSKTGMAEVNVNSTLCKSEDSKEICESLSEKIDLNSAQLQISINAVKATLDNVLMRVMEAENCIGETEGKICEIKQLTKQLKRDNKFLNIKLDQLENHSRRNNVRVVGLKEDTEGMDPVKFVTDWIPDILGPTAQTQCRGLGEPPRLSPRPVLIHLLRLQDLEKILALAKRKGNICYNNLKISLFPDMSPELTKCH